MTSAVLIETDPSIHLKVRSALAAVELKLAPFVDTSAARYWLEENPAPAMVIIDRDAPTDPFDFCRSLRESPRLERVPVVVLASTPSFEDEAAAFASGVAFVNKPTEVDAYVALFSRMLRRAAHLRRWSPRPSLLIVDDDAAIRDALTNIVREEGWEPVCAESGPEALALCGAAAPAPSLAFIDVMLPELDGVALTARLRRAQTMSSMPIVIMSAFDDVELNARKAGAVAHLKKPFPLDDVVTMMHRAVLGTVTG